MKNWEDLVASKKTSQQASIPQEWIITPNLLSSNELNVLTFPSGFLTPQEVEITNTHVDALLAKLANAEWSSVAVTTAFGKRAVIAHQLTNCLTEVFIERALARAAELDAHLKATGKPVGLLHGLPISLKDQVSIKGIESIMAIWFRDVRDGFDSGAYIGYVSWIGQYAERNAVLVDILEALGAVLYVKTNVPQTLMWPETYNFVFGRTSNPSNRSLTSGGSSGGEGALVALNGSPLGVGSDIGGSIRIPSGFCGTYGFRPSTGLVPYSGSVNSLEGQDSIPSVLGPLANSIYGLKIFMQGVLSQKPWLRDPLVIRRGNGWDEEEYALVTHGMGRELCFAVMWDDGVIVPHPPIVRGMEMARRALVKAGHKVIDWKPLDHKTLFDTGVRAHFASRTLCLKPSPLSQISIYMAGAPEDFAVISAESGEPLIRSMVPGKETETPDPASASTTKGQAPTSAYELWQFHKKRRSLREAYLEHWLATVKETGTGRPVDAIIAPVAPFTAVPHGKDSYTGYTVVWNVLDFPALVIPVSRVDPKLDVKKPAHEFFSDLDRSIYELYEPETFKDAPIGFQVVGRTQEDEAVIAMSEIVDAALKAL
ncbi:hypothetical protein C0995_014841 [Termitomyces sp. Mi166|nr:hypothetical protein C0995_014841 [Termitomyces sp. Mi166\